jgi:hypothetical protein
MDAPSPQRKATSERVLSEILTKESTQLPALPEDILAVELQPSEDYGNPGDGMEESPARASATRDISAADASVSDAASSERERKERKTNWIHDRVKVIGGGKRGCKFCIKTYGEGSSTDTIISHLRSHKVVAPDIRPLPIATPREFGFNPILIAKTYKNARSKNG